MKYAGPEEGELEYLLRHIRSAEGPTLELACSTGRILIPLAEQGIEMTGIDVSEDMLERCRQKCAEKNLKANLHIQAMQELDLEERFGSVLIASASLSVLDSEADVDSLFTRVFEHMFPGGVFLMEHNAAPDWHQTEDQRRMWDGDWHNAEDGSVIVVWYQRKYDSGTHVARNLGIYERYVEGRLWDTELHEGTTGLWNTEMLRRHLLAAGFVDIAVSAPFKDDTPPQSGWTAMRSRKPG